MTTAEVISPCPQCGAGLFRRRDDPPWCPSCEWNLAAWPEPKKMRAGRRRRLLRARREAFALDRMLLDEFGGVRPERPRATRPKIVLAAVAGALIVTDLAALAGGLYVLVAGNWRQRILAVVLVLVALVCRLRFHKVDTAFGQLDRAQAPQFFAVLDAAADALGAPRADVVLVDDDYNAFVARSGLRHCVVVSVGLPLWGSLSPAGRWALLGHEFGHLVNGDPTTGVWTEPALTTFARLALIFDPRALTHWHHEGLALVARGVAYVTFGPFYLFCAWAHGVLIRLSARDSRRAETYADGLAARLGGTEGAADLARNLLLTRATLFALRRAAAEGSADPVVWRERVVAAQVAVEPELRIREQESMRSDTSRYGSHPPAGLRHRLVRSWSRSEPVVPVPVEAMAAADRELARRYEQVRKSFLNRTLV